MAYSVVVDGEFLLEWYEYFGQPQVWYISYIALLAGQLELKENGNGSGNGKRERKLVKIVVIHRILYQ